MNKKTIRKIRLDAGLSLDKFAKLVGRDRTQIIRYEQGYTKIPLCVSNSVRWVEHSLKEARS